MQNWEYMIVTEQDWKAKWINGKEIPNWQNGPRIEDYLNSLGSKAGKRLALQCNLTIFSFF